MNGRYQPALLGGLFIGVLSSVPLVSLGNVCCCLWVVVGGLLTVYLQHQNRDTPVETSEAILGGLLAGLIGAVITGLASYALLTFSGTLWQDQARNAIESNPEVPPQVRDFVVNMMTGRGVVLLQMAVTVPLYAIFSMLGGLLGLALFKKKVPPTVAP